ncbi:MAG TPA: RNA-splicing ligase RtcB [Candidatus Moranbacteria bacterium]|nr:RNA-splicing ligase RtcB [Candidatus Moranbacteria bacterium]
MRIGKENLIKINEYLWEIPRSFRGDMQAPARIYASEEMLDEMLKDRSLWQLVNVATIDGIKKEALVMPDAHEGYGFPIGGVAAVSYPDGMISPGGIGYDINCGVRLLISELSYSEIEPHLEDLLQRLYREIPSGVGRGGSVKLKRKDIDDVLNRGVAWAIENGYAEESDPEHIESGGSLDSADSAKVSEHAKKRGSDQLGTMGAGNHFVEVGRVDEIFDEKIAGIFGLKKNQITVLIHTGSRGLGHQVATDYIKLMQKAMPGYGISVPDRELAGVPFSSKEGQDYFTAMSAAANFAWTNRQLISWEVRKVWKSFFGEKGGLSLLYDVAHNIAKIEEYEIGGKKEKFIIHRKGATRAFGPGHPELAGIFSESGQPVIIPGSMGTASYVLAGTKEGMEKSFGSSCHGAGRRMSRHAAKRAVRGEELKKELEKEGIYVRVGSIGGLAEEAPLAYKDIDDVVGVVAGAGIARKVARLRPVLVIKG